MRAVVVSLVFVALLAFAAPAGADQRYAAPTGSGAECTKEKPCAIDTSIGSAKANDEVIVMPGTYEYKTPGSLASFENIFIHGEFGAPKPLIKAKVPGALLFLGNPKGRVAHLELLNESNGGGGITCPVEGTIEGVTSAVKGSPSAGLTVLEGCAVRNSVALAEGKGASAINAVATSALKPGTIRNVTAVATGPESVGLQIFGSSGPYTVNVRNSILSGADLDLWTRKTAEGGGLADIAYSNFDAVKADPGTTITQGAGNQSAPPLFVDAAGGNFREATGSPTIDGGTAEGVLSGETDYDGNARVLGPAPDIGAFEVVSVVVVPPPAAASLVSLTVSPKAFRTLNGGQAIFSARKKAAPVGATVSYALSAAASVSFSVERKVLGRKAGTKCVAKTKANKGKPKCPLYKAVKGGFTHSGAAGANSFKFSGRIGGKALKPGAYRLVGKTGTSALGAGFKIVK
jgi:hypothetical protein